MGGRHAVTPLRSAASFSVILPAVFGGRLRHVSSVARALLLSAVLLIGCGPQPTLPPGSFDPVRIGVITPLTGDLGTDGLGWANAARLAARELNAAGGPLPGRPIELVVVDDETNSARGQPLARRLIEQDGVVAIVGAAASSVSLEVAQVATEARIPQISCCSTSDLLTSFNENLADESDRYFFRTAPPDSLQSLVVAIAAADLACTRLAILHIDDGYGEPFGLGIAAAFEADGGEVVARVPFPEEQASYTAEVAQIRDAMPDCVALVAFPVSGGRILRDWTSLAARPTVTWIGTDGVRAPGFVDEVGDAALLDGFFGTSPITDGATPEYNDFHDRYEAVFGEAPVPFSSNQYDAVALLGLAIAYAESTDGPAIRDALRSVASPPADRGVVVSGRLAEGLAEIREGREVDYLGASGNTDFNAAGDVVTPYEIWRYDAPDSSTPCSSSTAVPNNRGRFCRFRTLTAEEIDP